MRYFFCNKVKKKISLVCFGTWSLGGATEKNPSYRNIKNQEVTKILRTSYNFGINFYDTSPAYGKSEKLLGNFMQNYDREDFVISTKVGCDNFSKPTSFKWIDISRQLENSFKNLKTKYIDIVLFHNPSQISQIKKVIQKLKNYQEKGKIKALGASLSKPEDLIKFKNLDLDYFQINFSIFDQRLLRYKCYNKKIMYRTIYNFGFLTDEIAQRKRLSFNKNDHRSKWSKEQIKLWHFHAKFLLKKYVRNIKSGMISSLKELAFRFVLSFKKNSFIIVGITKKKDLNICKNKNIFYKLNQRIKNQLVKYYKENTFFYKKIRRSTELQK